MYNTYQFGVKPKANIGRNKFDLSRRNFGSCAVGELVPVFYQEILPGDSFKVKTNLVVRSSNPFLRPVMDNLFADIHYFFVPFRLAYDKFVNVMGENTESAWANTQDYSIPSVPKGIVSSKSVSDYLGFPVGAMPAGASVLPQRCFALIYNEWYRNENVVDPVFVNTGELNATERYNNDEWSPTNYFGKLPKVGKLHDYFTTALPSPQKSENPVELILNFNDLPVVPREGVNNYQFMDSSHVYITDQNGDEFGTKGYLGVDSSVLGIVPNMQATQTDYAVPANLVALGKDLASGISVNDLRYALALQRILERDATGGSRYVEILANAFGVISPDSRLQRPEYLGGWRQPLNFSEVAQTAPGVMTDENNDPLATVSAYSLTNGRHTWSKSFLEHGAVIGCMCLKSFHTYSQGVPKTFTRLTRTQFYDPELGHIGETPVFTSELYVDNTSTLNDTIFGYQEAWADYRYGVSTITGQMRSNVPNSFDIYHFGDNYASAPVLSQDFIQETGAYVDRTLSADSSEVDPFLFNFYYDVQAIRPLPLFSTPSLVGHK